MARRPREDWPGSLHHVMNRGIARRTMFENENDIRDFLALFVHAKRRGEIEIRAFAIMTTHYHVLLHSPVGQLGPAMGRIQSEYSRSFNRSRKRDGPLVRTRYTSRPVRSVEDEICLYAYIHNNPVKAGIVGHPTDYPFSSAYHFTRGSGPRWLDRGPVDWWIEARSGVADERAAYDRVFSPALAEQSRDLIERRLAGKLMVDPLVDLVDAAPERVRAWMERKARLADGTRPGLPACGAAQVEQAIRVVLDLPLDGDIGASAQVSLIRPLRAGLLHDLAGIRVTSIAAIVGANRSTVGNDLNRHRQLVADDPSYGTIATRVIATAIESWRDENGIAELARRARRGSAKVIDVS